jgi:hypothetical protein
MFMTNPIANSGGLGFQEENGRREKYKFFVIPWMNPGHFAGNVASDGALRLGVLPLSLPMQAGFKSKLWRKP